MVAVVSLRWVDRKGTKGICRSGGRMTTVADPVTARAYNRIPWRRFVGWALLPLLPVLTAACRGEGHDVGSDRVIIDPTRLATGDSLLGLRILSLDARPEVVDSFGWSGEVRFSGLVTLSGEYRPHPEAPLVQDICFYPDSASAGRLPRFPNDRRYSWLCFENSDRTRAMLQAGSGEATVAIDSFRYLYEHTDSYNTAHLDSVLDAEGAL